MRTQKLFRCIKSWQRNLVGDIVEEWEYLKYPNDVRERHFVEVNPKNKFNKSTAKSNKSTSKSNAKRVSKIITTNTTSSNISEVETFNDID